MLFSVDMVKRGIDFSLEDILAFLFFIALFCLSLLFLFRFLVHILRNILLPDVSIGGKAIQVLVDLGQLSAELLQHVHVVLLRDNVVVNIGYLGQYFSLYLPSIDVVDVVVYDLA